MSPSSSTLISVLVIGTCSITLLIVGVVYRLFRGLEQRNKQRLLDLLLREKTEEQKEQLNELVDDEGIYDAWRLIHNWSYEHNAELVESYDTTPLEALPKDIEGMQSKIKARFWCDFFPKKMLERKRKNWGARMKSIQVV